VPLDGQVRDAILRAMERGGHPRVTLPSWAGHDAGVMARYAPSGMIFVTSTAGISHSPQEHTPWEAAAAGAQVLLDTLLLLDEAPGRPARLPLAYAG
jgi:acetylornithine deacetylase/succinyl-diaminopimelate desuccinylase-like protein